MAQEKSPARAKVQGIDVGEALDNVRSLLEEERYLSPALRSALDLLLILVTVMMDRLTLNSRNSSKPPSLDPNRKKEPKKRRSPRKPGGQAGHAGANLQKVDSPDEVKFIAVDRRTLPKGRQYQEIGSESRQIIEIEVSRYVIEYQAQILEDEQGNRFVAPFPDGVARPVQYGHSVRSHAVYMSQFQLLPYDRIRDHFRDQLEIPISAGTVFNFNKAAYHNLVEFEQWAKHALATADLVHADETGININGRRHWLHSASNAAVTLFYPHAKRGTEAMDEAGILPSFQGVLCHDHWKPYYRYDCMHALCNAHHLRELERAWEQDQQQWARKMKALLVEINEAVDAAGGCLSPQQSKRWRKKYRIILDQADIECPPPNQRRQQGQRGRIKRSKARNLLERLRNYQDDVLRFMDLNDVPFTNNQGENDIRMTKVQQKISGCFRSMQGAKIFCRVRSYLSTCRKQGMTATRALEILFNGETPDFMANAKDRAG